MRDLLQLASFVAPSTRQAGPANRFCDSNCANVLSPRIGNILGGNGVALRASEVPEPAGVYEAVLPQTETLVGMGFILVLCVALYWVWENQVVPVSRTKLAISKSRGEVKEYLDELKATAPTASSSVDDQNSVSESEELLSLAAASANATVTTTGDNESPAQGGGDDRAFERWLFTDWLQDNKSARKGGRQKEPALPILKDAKWNSGDNPVVVAAFLMLVGITVTAFTERLASFG